ncbi:PREDICTED: thyroid receptor-interacting protein 11-like isoform X2 [Nicrophorus vespilloides]|uniref:Thyroid receptor-interacting protein 11-like isoform X2 n=1 Tax=Nicrophorus vespilloides TaxID=110193 RepID=A0ABM1NCB3_NICVS|nr:PREDICTED: thyroid receptor-interacting protein 11-like isoform X2 [Nicrophorus vespilloides]
MKEITWPQTDRYSRPQGKMYPSDNEKQHRRFKPLDENRSAYSDGNKSYRENTEKGFKQITWPEDHENYEPERDVATKINKQEIPIESQDSQSRRDESTPTKPFIANRSFIPVHESRRKRDAKRNKTVDPSTIAKAIVWPKKGGYNEVDSGHEINLQTHDLQGQRSELPGTVRPLETTPFSAEKRGEALPMKSSLTQSGLDNAKSGLHPKFEDKTRLYEIPKTNRRLLDGLAATKNSNKSKQRRTADHAQLNAQLARPGRSRSLMDMKSSYDMQSRNISEKRNRDKLVEPKSSLNVRGSDTSRSSYNNDNVLMRPSRSRDVMNGKSQRRMYYLNSYGELMRMPRYQSSYRYGPHNSRLMGSSSLMRMGYIPSWFLNRQRSFDMPPYYSPRRNETRGFSDFVNSCVNPQDDDVEDDMMRRSRSGSLFDLNRPYNDMYYRNSYGRLIRPLGYNRMYDPMRGRFYKNRMMGWNKTVDAYGRPVNSLYQRSSLMEPSYFDRYGRRIHQFDSDVSCMVPRDPFSRFPRRTRSMIDLRRRPSFRRNSFEFENNPYRRFDMNALDRRYSNQSNISPYDDLEREIIRPSRSRSMIDLNRRSSNNMRRNSRGELINSPRYGLSNDPYSRSGRSGRSYNNRPMDRNNFIDVYKKPSNVLNRRYDYNVDVMSPKSSKSLMDLDGRSSRKMQYENSSDKNRKVPKYNNKKGTKYNSNARSSKSLLNLRDSSHKYTGRTNKQNTAEQVIGAPKKQNLLQNAPKYNKGENIKMQGYRMPEKTSHVLSREKSTAKSRYVSSFESEMPYRNDTLDQGRFRWDSSEEYDALNMRKSPHNSEEKHLVSGFIETVKHWIPLGSQAPETTARKGMLRKDEHDSFGSMGQGTSRNQFPVISSKAENDSHDKDKKIKKITYDLPPDDSVIEIIGAPRKARRSSSKSLESKSIILARDRNKSFENKSETRLYIKMIKKKMKKAMLAKLQSEIAEKGAQMAHDLKETGKLLAEVCGVEKVPSISGISDIVDDVRESCFSCKKMMIKRLKSGNLREEDINRELSFMKRKLKKTITKKVKEVIEDKAASLAKESKRSSSDYRISNESFPAMSDDGIVESVVPKVNVQPLQAKLSDYKDRPKEVNCCKISRTNSNFKLDIDLEDFVDQVKNVMIEKAEETLEEKRLSLIESLGLDDNDLLNIGKDELQKLLRRAGGMDSMIPLTGSDHSACSQQLSDTKLMQDIVMDTGNRKIWDTMHRERQTLVDDLHEKDKQLMDMHDLVSMTMRRLVVVFDGFHQIHDYTEAIRKEICASSSDCIKKQTKECFEREKLMELEEENSELKEVIGKSTDNLAALEGKTEELISENCQLQECQLEYVQKIEILEAEKMELMNNCCQMQDKLERLSHTEEISIESENMIQTLRFELDDVRKKNEDCLCTIECLSGEKQEQCCKIESLEKCVKDLSKKIETKDTGVQWSRPSSPKGRFGRRRSPARSRSYDDEHEEREESVFTFDLSCTGNRDKKPSKRTRSKGRHRSRSKDDDHDDVDYDSLLEKSRYKTHHNIHDNRRYNDSDTANSEERSHHANQSNFHRNYKVSKRDGNRDNSRYYSSNHGSSREESDLEDDDDKMLIVRRKPSNTSLFDDDDFSEITKSHREPLYATKPDLDKRISFSDSADQQTDQTLGDLKVVKLTAISTNAQPWCQLQGTVHEIKDSVSRIIVKENEVKLAHQRIAELEEQVQWAYRTMECEVEAARGCREREVCNLKQTIQTLLLNLNDEKQRSENLQRAVDLYLNSISVLESSESNLKREISEQKVTIGNLQDALVSVKQGLDEQRTRTDQEFECFEMLVERLRDENLLLEEGLFYNSQDIDINESRVLKYQQLFKELTNECTHLKQELMQLEVQKVDQEAFVEELNTQLMDCKNELRNLYLILTREQELMEDESSKLAKEIVRMQEEIFTLSDQLAFTTRNLENEKKTVSSLEVAVAKKECEMVCFKKEIQILEEKLESSSGEISGLKQRLLEVQNIRKEEIKRVQELEAKYFTKNQEFDMVSADYTTSMNTLKNVQMELRGSEERHCNEIGKYNLMVTGLKEQLIASDTKAKCFERELELARDKIAETTEDEMKLIQEKTLRETAHNEDMREYQREQNRLIDVVTTLEQRLAVINCELSQKDKELDELKGNFVAVSSESQLHQEEICGLKNEINSLIQQQSLMKCENDRLQTQVGKLKMVIGKNDEKNEIMMRELEQCLAELQVIQRDKEFLMEKNTALAQEIRSLQNACQLKTESVVTLEMELSDTKSIKETLCTESKHIIDNVKSWLHEQQKLNVELNDKIKSKNTIISKLNEKIASMETKNRGQRAESPYRVATPPRGWSLGSCESPPCSWSSEAEWETVDNETAPQVWLHRVESLTEELQRNNRFWKNRMTEHDYVVSRDN